MTRFSFLNSLNPRGAVGAVVGAVAAFKAAHPKRWRWVVLGACAVMGWVAFMLFTQSTTAPKMADGSIAAGAAKTKPALTVKLMTPATQNVMATLSADGKIMAWQEAVLGAQVNGLQLVEVRANVGDVVKKGQVLARFNTSTVNAELAQSSANVAEANALLAQAKADHARAQSLKGTGAISTQQLEQFDTSLKAAQARLHAAQAARVVGAQRVQQALVVAPDEGVISARNATVGSVAQAGQELFRMVLKNRLEWRAELTADQIKQVAAGRVASIELSDGESIKGVVRQVAPTLNEKTNSATVYADLLNVGGARAGMFAKGHFELAPSDALMVPQTAVVMRDGFNYVFTVVEHKAVQVKVGLGRRSDTQVEILSGLTAGQAIVASGADFLKDGDTVEVTP